MKDTHIWKLLAVRFGSEIGFGFESEILDLTTSSDNISKAQKIETPAKIYI